MSPERTYLCDCPRHCGTLREVSKRTYFAHAPYRRDRIQHALDNYLAEHRGHPPPPEGPNNANNSDEDEDMSDDEDDSILDPDEHLDQDPMQQDQPEDDFDDLYANEAPPLAPPVGMAEDLRIDPFPQAAYHEEIAGLDDDAHDYDVQPADPGCLNDVDPDIDDGQDAPHAQDDLDPALPPTTLEDLNISLAYIHLLRSATLDNGDLDAETIHRLRHPPEGPPDVDDPDLLLAIKIYLATTKASQDTYTTVGEAISDRFPECDFPSISGLKAKIIELTGIIPIINDMCDNSCIGYTGPFADLTHCPKCGQFRYDHLRYDASNGTDRVPRKTFLTIPLGPQLQAMWRSRKSAEAMRYRSTRSHQLKEEIRANNGVVDGYEDFLSGAGYLDAFNNGRIGDHDTTLMLSLDGAQLFRNKLSNFWLSIWGNFDLAPDSRYKTNAVPIGSFIPGPNAPQNFDSFFFPSLHHLSALQREGFHVWDAYALDIYLSRPFFAIGAADGPGATHANGLVGHMGYVGCRIYCPMMGRRLPDETTYYTVHLKPLNFVLEGSDHDDYLFERMPVRPPEEYYRNLRALIGATSMGRYIDLRRETGISKPSIFSGLPSSRMIQIPTCFAPDIMHIIALNKTSLLLDLWRGKMPVKHPDDKATWDWAVLRGDTWEAHGKSVADATPYLPGSFDRPPRNPAEKISSGYKAWEFLTYIFVLGPGLLYGILPGRYHTNFCKLVSAIRTLHQRMILKDELLRAHRLIVDFVREFEEIYYQRKPERMHFCRPVLHVLLHLAPLVHTLGPPCYYTQWMMERTIGNLTEEMKQPSQPFANLAQRGLRRAQVNALKAIIPNLEKETKQPKWSEDVGDGYVLLHARDETARTLTGPQAVAVRDYMGEETGENVANWDPPVRRWARLRLPTGQIARSAWKEKLKALEKVRISRNVRYELNDTLFYGEVQFFFQATIHDATRTLAVVSNYSPPDLALLRQSHDTLWTCHYQGADDLRVIDVKTIHSVVAMVPFPFNREKFFVGEKIGLDVAMLGGIEEEDLA